MVTVIYCSLKFRGIKGLPRGKCVFTGTRSLGFHFQVVHFMWKLEQKKSAKDFSAARDILKGEKVSITS
jgi:hypothetical protein